MNVKMDKDNMTVSADITNSGQFDGDEVVQLYVKFPGDDAAKRLRGFKRINISKGQTKTVEIIVAKDDLKLWNTAKNAFDFTPGTLTVQLGASSADIRLSKEVEM